MRLSFFPTSSPGIADMKEVFAADKDFLAVCH